MGTTSIHAEAPRDARSRSVGVILPACIKQSPLNSWWGRGSKFKQDFWRAEVIKMIKVYGAPIDEANVGEIVDYLAQTY